MDIIIVHLFLIQLVTKNVASPCTIDFQHCCFKCVQCYIMLQSISNTISYKVVHNIPKLDAKGIFAHKEFRRLTGRWEKHPKAVEKGLNTYKKFESDN